MLLIDKEQGSAIVPTVLTFEYCRKKGLPCPKCLINSKEFHNRKSLILCNMHKLRKKYNGQNKSKGELMPFKNKRLNF